MQQGAKYPRSARFSRPNTAYCIPSQLAGLLDQGGGEVNVERPLPIAEVTCLSGLAAVGIGPFGRRSATKGISSFFHLQPKPPISLSSRPKGRPCAPRGLILLSPRRPGPLPAWSRGAHQEI